jgi:hypothetical protein
LKRQGLPMAGRIVTRQVPRRLAQHPQDLALELEEKGYGWLGATAATPRADVEALADWLLTRRH